MSHYVLGRCKIEEPGFTHGSRDRHDYYFFVRSEYGEELFPVGEEPSVEDFFPIVDRLTNVGFFELYQGIQISAKIEKDYGGSLDRIVYIIYLPFTPADKKLLTAAVRERPYTPPEAISSS